MDRDREKKVCLRAEVWITARCIAPVWAAGTVSRGAVIGLACTGYTVAGATIFKPGSAVSTRGAAAEGWHC